MEFPLNEQRTDTVSSASLQTQFKPSNNLEHDLQGILEKYGYTESAMMQREKHQLEQRELSAQEIQEKQQHLAQLKSLLFYHEIKQKRLKKIKSKQYRKLKKKREEGKKVSAEELERLNPAAVQDQQEQQQAARIKERMTQRHKNTSKWAKEQLRLMKTQRMGPNLLQARTAIEQQLGKHQKLSRKLDKKQQEEEESSEDLSDDEETVEGVRSRFKAQIAELKNEEPAAKKTKGIAGLKFMQKGLDKKQKETDQLIEDALLSDEDAEKPPQPQSAEQKSRKSFNPAASLSNAPNLNEEGRIDMLSNGFQSSKVGFSKGFLVGTDRPVEVSQKKSEQLFEVEDFSDHETDQQKIIEFKTPVIQPPKSILKRKGTDVESEAKKPVATSKSQVSVVGEDSEVPETENPWQANVRAAKTQPVKLDTTDLHLLSGTSSKFNLLNTTDTKTVGGQEKLVKEAFSLTGEAEQMFKKEKEELVTADLPKFEDHAVPGWGHWSDANSKPRPLSKMKLKIKEAIEKKAAAEAAGRQDAKLANVIISQKTDKKSLKFMVPQLPYPFTSVEQFDKAQRTPVGSEWNTMNTFQDTIKPAVITKPGEIIEPIARKRKKSRT